MIGTEPEEEDTVTTETLNLSRRDARSRRLRVNNWVQDRPYVSWPLNLSVFLLPLVALASPRLWSGLFTPDSPGIPLTLILILLASLVLMLLVGSLCSYPQYLADGTRWKADRPGWDSGRMVGELGEIARVLECHVDHMRTYTDVIDSHGTVRERRRAALLIERAEWRRHITHRGWEQLTARDRRPQGRYGRNRSVAGAWEAAQRDEHQAERTLIVLDRIAANATARNLGTQG